MLTALPNRLELLDEVFLKKLLTEKKLISRTQAQYIKTHQMLALLLKKQISRANVIRMNVAYVQTGTSML